MKDFVKKNSQQFLKHINKEKLKYIVLLSVLTVFLIMFTLLTPTTKSKYATETNSNAQTQIAFYLLHEDYLTSNILLDEIAPRNEPYTYNFKIANNRDIKITETDLQYDLSIRTTTNLPLTYELYLNEVYTDNNAQNIITDENVVQDDDGTYFNIFSTDTEYFGHITKETNEYQLVVYFPSINIDEIYQDIIESIEITVDSKQIIN